MGDDPSSMQPGFSPDPRKTEWLKRTESIGEIGHWYVDLKEETVFWSDQVFRIHGSSPADYQPGLESAINCYHPDDRQSVMDAISRAVGNGEDFEFERRIVRTDGEIRWVASKGECRFGEDGKVVALFGVIQDITARREKADEIRETKERYESAMEGARIGFWEIDPAEPASHWSPLIFEILGLPSGTTLDGAALEERIHPDDLEAGRFLIAPQSAEPGEYSATVRMRTAGGEYVYVQFRGTAQHDRATGRTKISGSFIDETEDHRGKLLRDSIWRTLTEQNLGLDAKIHSVLDQTARYYGLENGVVARIESETYVVRNALSPDGGIRGGDVFDLGNTYCMHVLRAGGVRAFHYVAESEIRAHPCYQKFGLEAYIGAPLTVDGRRYGVVSFSSPSPRPRPFSRQEIQLLEIIAHWLGYEIARQRAMLRLEESEERFALAAKGASVGIWDWPDVNTGGEIWSDHFYRLLDYEPGEVEASLEAFRSVLHPDDHERTFRAVEKHLAGEAPFEVEYRLLCKKRGYRWFLGTGQAVWDAAGAPRRMIGTIMDIDARKRAESMKSEFVSTVSHELRTPMTSIMGSIGLVRSGKFGDLSPRASQLLEIAEKNGQRLVRLINDLLDIEKIEAGKLKFAMSRISLQDQVREAVDQNASYAAEQGAEMRVSDKSGRVFLMADPDRVQQVLTNLISNAAKFSGAGGRLEIEIKSDHDLAHIAVKDNGPGIPPDMMGAIFDRFVQADSGDTRKTGGTGLGLSISKAIAEAHGGAITVESEPGTGSVFTLHLPLWTDIDEESRVAGGSLEALRGRPRILHVEDDEDTRSLLEHLVEDFADIDAAGTIGEAEKRLDDASYHLVVLDMQLPDGSGERVIERLDRARGRRTPVIVYSVFDYARPDPPGFIHSRLVKSRVRNSELRDNILHALNLSAENLGALGNETWDSETWLV